MASVANLDRQNNGLSAKTEGCDAEVGGGRAERRNRGQDARSRGQSGGTRWPDAAVTLLPLSVAAIAIHTYRGKAENEHEESTEVDAREACAAGLGRVERSVTRRKNIGVACDA